MRVQTKCDRSKKDGELYVQGVLADITDVKIRQATVLSLGARHVQLFYLIFNIGRCLDRKEQVFHALISFGLKNEHGNRSEGIFYGSSIFKTLLNSLS